MPLQQTSGNVTADAYGGGAAAVPNYIENVFSTWLYTGNGSTQTITNGIDLAGKGGMVWIKSRSAGYHNLVTDTAQGIGSVTSLVTNTTGVGYATALSAFTSTGFTTSTTNGATANGANFVSWAVCKQPKFFDEVTYTGDGTTGRQLAHSLGSIPGCVIIKKTSTTSAWPVYHRSTGFDFGLALNTAESLGTTQLSPITAATSSTITLYQAAESGGSTACNVNGVTYVAYLFAHNAGGFGLTGTDNVISCGSFVANSDGTVDASLGFEPQWLLYKSSTNFSDWRIIDNMRGWSMSGNTAVLYPNLSNAEQNAAVFGNPTATGFHFNAGGLIADATYIYIAIRRGPMKVPTDATKVFAITTPAVNSTPRGTVATIGFPTDLIMGRERGVYAGSYWFNDRLRGLPSAATGTTATIRSAETTAETSETANFYNLWNTTAIYGARSENNATDNFFLARAPGFFDEVCYTGTGAATTVTHNLGVVPELMIIKCRSDSTLSWPVYYGINTDFAYLNSSSASQTGVSIIWNSTSPTSSVFSIGTSVQVNYSANTFVAYLFASCPGVSKVGSYTGNGSTQTINCGFTGGARFVLIKRTDSTGDWYVYDTARGMTTLTDPYLLLNSTAAESATLGSVTTVTTGFAVNASILAAINTNGASYIFLAIA